MKTSFFWEFIKRVHAIVKLGWVTSSKTLSAALQHYSTPRCTPTHANPLPCLP